MADLRKRALSAAFVGAFCPSCVREEQEVSHSYIVESVLKTKEIEMGTKAESLELR